MRLVTWLFLAAAALAAPQKALAASEDKPLTLKVPKAALAAPAPVHANAPFTTPAAEPELVLAPSHEVRQQKGSACESSASLCYDSDDHRLVFKPARNFMPELPGLTRENISVKRDRIVFRYSF